MALTNAEKQAQFRKKNAELGRFEMRSIYATKSEQVILKKLCKKELESIRCKNRDTA